MGRAFGLLTLVTALAIGAYIYTRQAESVTSIGSNPETTVDVIAVRNDLITIAKAERNHWATHSKYATLDELVLNGDIEMPHREDFTYSAETNEAGFRIVASYSGSDPEAPSRISVDETMTISSE